ncbi:hypothetical protein LG201_07945 [Methylobacillus gramineus]|uniref:hypothetical protein n=1 Tax=Methylobacillus gramineus TaxID=755169 RepID=UPI001CFF88B5|nr:hypothetical protein [Methylobacillus gramineus]MCB5185134.1 hypothetical protein [Methylobacillus gramineus]
MCRGVKFTDASGLETKILFPHLTSALPIKYKDGKIKWLRWGNNLEEKEGGFFVGGWARKTSLDQGKWDKLKPEKVNIMAHEFMGKDQSRISHWIDIPEGHAIQGVIATHHNERRIYVVTTEPPEEYAWIGDRWPLIAPVSH